MTPLACVYPVETHWFNTSVDHFNFRHAHGADPGGTFPLRYSHHGPPADPGGTFPLRYLVHAQQWDGTGPVLFYTGNEGDIVSFANNSGLLFELAADPELRALVVFAEHRYYGESWPFGGTAEASLGSGANASYLTVEQALADFNLLTGHIRRRWSVPDASAFVAFGGSYGANLAMWSRLKNPNLWAGAVASSATPLKSLLRATNGFARIETEVYANVSAKCPELVRLGWSQLFAAVKTAEGRVQAAKVLGLCKSLPESGSDAAESVMGWLDDALETMVQYPYPSAFYKPVPAYPFRVACRNMIKAAAGDSETREAGNWSGLRALRAASDVYYNWTGSSGPCYPWDEDDQSGGRGSGGSVLAAAERYWRRRQGAVSGDGRINLRGLDQGGRVAAAAADAWDYQCCTEVYQPMPTDGVTDFERPHTPNASAIFEACEARWGVTPRPDWEETEFMGSHIASGSNLFLTNGQLDPWRAAGIQELPEGSPESVTVRTIESAAHHLDLRHSDRHDPPSVAAVRREERTAILRWVREWRLQHQAERRDAT